MVEEKKTLDDLKEVMAAKKSPRKLPKREPQGKKKKKWLKLPRLLKLNP